MSIANRVAAAHRCMFGTAAAHCGEPATMHVLLDDGQPTMSCALHAEWWELHPHDDQHPIGATCGMPGTTWLYRRPGHTGRCIVEGLGAGLTAALAGDPAPTPAR